MNLATTPRCELQANTRIATQETIVDKAALSTIPLRWRHVILNTHSSWLHGDPRGFRSRDHRIHSSGDYRNPPPEGEHARLHEWMKKRAGPKVVFEEAVWQTIAEALRDRLLRLDRRILAVSMSAVHVHLLVELPDLPSVYRDECGLAKRFATEQVKGVLTGKLWAAGGTFKPIVDLDHQRRTYIYITTKQRPAWVWDYEVGGRIL